MHHELQIHRRNYVCKVCQKICSSRKEMSAHLREHYDESISPSHLGAILDFCNRQVDIFEYEKHSCLVCGEELLLPALQGHLAAHMEDIALFVLPNTNEKDDVGDSKASVNVAKLKSKGNTSGTESEPSSPLSTKEGRNFTSAPEENPAPHLLDDRKPLNRLTKPISYFFRTFI